MASVFIFTGCSTTEHHSIDLLTYFDTVITISAYCSWEDFSEISTISNTLLQKYHEFFDIYNNYSGVNNIKTINDSAGIEAVKVEPEILDIINFSIEQYHLTNGYMNIAMGAVLEIWHHYREDEITPNEEDLKEAFLHTNIEDIIVDNKNSTIYLSNEKMSLDLGAVAKGYAIDLIAQTLQEKGYTSVMINSGGTIITTGKKPDNTEWKVGIQNYDLNDENPVISGITLDDEAISTSGDYQRFYTIDGVDYHHIINKDTLFPSEYFHSISVIANSAAIADSLSTALFCTQTHEEILKNYEDVYVIDFPVE